MSKPKVRHCFGEEANVLEVKLNHPYATPAALAAGLKALAKDIESRYCDDDALGIQLTSHFDSGDHETTIQAVVFS